MKIVICESRLSNLVKNYLNDIDWFVTDNNDGFTVRLFFRDKMLYPEDAILQSSFDYDFDDATPITLLMVNRAFFGKLKSLFGLTSKELSKILLEWFREYTNEDVNYLYFME